MRKLFLAIAIILMMSVSMATQATQTSLQYVIENNSGSDLSTTVSTLIIIPGIHKILGYRVMPLANTYAGAWAALYSGTMADNHNLIGESEAGADSDSGEVWGYPKHTKEGGLTVKQSCYSLVIIEYTR